MALFKDLCKSLDNILIFRSKDKFNGLPRLLAIPINKIYSLETIFGSHSVYLKVNDIEVEESFEDTLKILDEKLSNIERSYTQGGIALPNITEISKNEE